MHLLYMNGHGYTIIFICLIFIIVLSCIGFNMYKETEILEVHAEQLLMKPYIDK